MPQPVKSAMRNSRNVRTDWGVTLYGPVILDRNADAGDVSASAVCERSTDVRPRGHPLVDRPCVRGIVASMRVVEAIPPDLGEARGASGGTIRGYVPHVLCVVGGVLATRVGADAGCVA